MIERDVQATASGQFQAAAADIDTIFESYRSLHSLYVASFASLEEGLGGMPASFMKKVAHARKAFSNAKGTVARKQEAISGQLHAQGLVLLVGAAESITKEVFHNLLINNIRKVKLKDSLSLSANEVLKVEGDQELAGLIFEVLASEGNPTEKLNFQNMQQLKGVMKGYLGIELDNDLMIELHEYWQIRHVAVHRASIIDKQFLDNLKKVEIPTEGYVLGKKVSVTKEMYDKCSSLLVLLFEALDMEIGRLGLVHEEQV